MNDWILRMFEKVVMIPLLVVISIGLTALLFIGIPVGIYQWATYTPPQTFALRYDEFACTKQHEQDREICAKGCRWVRDVVCDQWSRK